MDRVPIQIPSRSTAAVQTYTHTHMHAINHKVGSSWEYDEGSESFQAHVDGHEHLQFVHHAWLVWPRTRGRVQRQHQTNSHRHKGFRLWRLQGHQKVHCSTGGKIVIKKACAITSSSVHHSFWLNLGTHTCLKWCLLNLPSHHWPYPPIQGHRAALDNLCLSHITSGTWMDAFLTNAVATAEQQSDRQTGQQKSG